MVWMLIGALGNALAARVPPDAGPEGVDGGDRRSWAGRSCGSCMGRADRPDRRTAHGADRAWRLTMLPLLLGWLWVRQFRQLLLVGLLLGVPGASFAAALPMASRWYPPALPGARAWASPAPATAARRWPRSSAPASPSASAGTRSSAWRLIPVALTWPLLVAVVGRDAPDSRRPGRCASTPRRSKTPRRLVVLPVLLGHVRRLRRPGELPVHLLPRPVRRRASIQAGQLRHVLRRRRLVHPAARRPPRRPIRRDPHAAVALPGAGDALMGGMAWLPPLSRAIASDVRRRWRCWGWATARCSSSCRSVTRGRSAS